MSLKKKISEYILPKETNFFDSLYRQGQATLNIIEALHQCCNDSSEENLNIIISLEEKAAQSRKNYLKELNIAMVTPVNKEAIGRVYTHLQWIALSAKHLIVEVRIYELHDLSQFAGIIELLEKQMNALSKALSLLNNIQYDAVLEKIEDIVLLDDMIVESFAKDLAGIFSNLERKKVREVKEVLRQIKEIAKRVHFCANVVEEIIFKLN